MDSVLLVEVGQLTALQFLLLRNCAPFEDFNLFKQLSYLQELDISGCSYNSMNGLERLSSLNYLNLSSTNTTNLSYLPAVPTLVSLDLRDTPVTDLSPLLDCKLLQVVVLDKTQQRQAERQLRGASFELKIYLQ